MLFAQFLQKQSTTFCEQLRLLTYFYDLVGY